MINQGMTDMTAVNLDGWQTEQGIRSLSHDRLVMLTVPVTTQAVHADGTRVEVVTVDRIANPPPPAENEVLAVAIALGPEGARFNPPLSLSVSYANLEIPKNADLSKIQLYLRDGSRWVLVPSTVDPAAKTASTLIEHFSDYALIMPGLRGQPFAVEDAEGSGMGFAVFGGVAGAMLLGAASFSFLLVVVRRWRLAFISAPAALGAGQVSQAIVIQAQNSRGAPLKVGGDVHVRLQTSSSTGRFDLSPEGPFDGSTTRVELPKGSREATVYYKDTAAGDVRLGALSAYGLSKWIRSRPRARARFDLRIQGRLNPVAPSLYPDEACP